MAWSLRLPFLLLLWQKDNYGLRELSCQERFEGASGCERFIRIISLKVSSLKPCCIYQLSATKPPIQQTRLSATLMCCCGGGAGHGTGNKSGSFVMHLSHCPSVYNYWMVKQCIYVCEQVSQYETKTSVLVRSPPIYINIIYSSNKTICTCMLIVCSNSIILVCSADYLVPFRCNLVTVCRE